MVAAGYRVIPVQKDEVLARKYRIRLRYRCTQMAYGKEAKEKFPKILQVVVFDEDRYGRFVLVLEIYTAMGYLYRNQQEVMLKKGLAWHYTAYVNQWEKEARAKRIGMWASGNPQKISVKGDHRR